MSLKRVIAALALVTLPFIAACSEGPGSGQGATNPDHQAPTASAAPVSWTPANGPVNFRCHDANTGLLYTISLPPNQDDPRLQGLEDSRKFWEKPQVTWLIVEIDATQMIDPSIGVAGADVSWATDDYQSRETTAASSLLTEWLWSKEATYPDGFPKPDNYDETYNRMLKTAPNPHAKGYSVAGVEGPIDSMVGPVVTGIGFNQAPCQIAT